MGLHKSALPWVQAKHSDRHATTAKKSIGIFWRANTQYPWLFFGTIITWVVGLILQKILVPFIIAQAINELIRIHTQPQIDYWQIFAPYIIWVAILIVVSQLLTDAGLLLLSKLETKVRPQLQMRVFNLLTQQSLKFHANNFSGSLVNQTNKFTSAYISLTDTLIINFLILTVTSAVAITVTAFLLPIVAIAMSLWTIFFVWLNIKLTRRRLVLSRRAAEADSVLTAHLADAIGNVATIKAFGHEVDEAQIHNQKSNDRANKKYASWIASTRNDLVFGLMMGILQVSVLVLSIYAVMHGAVAIGTLLLVQVYITQLIGQLWSLSGISRSVEQAISDAAEMTEKFGEDIEVKDPKNAQPLHIKNGKIIFDNVSFTHDGGDDALFHHFNFQINPGEKIGLVGHSGSGKTTLTRLLLRFSDVDDGSITIDGQNIASVTQAELRQTIAYVPQEPLLFHRSLRENIAYGRPDASEEEIKDAAQKAFALEFIQALPHGFDTLVGERGVKLSGGQRQRIAIARAILKDAPILVLDEATSALDSESEKLIQAALWELMKGRTSIVIAHRLSTIQKMDRIVVLENGKITEEGTHGLLLKKPGTYARLWAHQSGGFLDE